MTSSCFPSSLLPNRIGRANHRDAAQHCPSAAELPVHYRRVRTRLDRLGVTNPAAHAGLLVPNKCVGRCKIAYGNPPLAALLWKARDREGCMGQARTDATLQFIRKLRARGGDGLLDDGELLERFARGCDPLAFEAL